jgi:hypothetical protein
MNPWKSSSLPVHATPTKLTDPANFWAASSTEGASRLQVLQVGAQNQNAVGLPAAVAPSNVPPPTSGAVNCSASGTVGRPVPAPDDGPTVDGCDGAALGVSAPTVDPAPLSSDEQAPSRTAAAVNTDSR